jgi:hypothetical protein
MVLQPAVVWSCGQYAVVGHLDVAQRNVLLPCWGNLNPFSVFVRIQVAASAA